MHNLKKLEQKGDVTFYEDSKGVMYQQIGTDAPFKVRNGKVVYKPICTVKGLKIKYNTNGVYGFAIFTDVCCVEDCIWSLKEAKRIANELGGL